VLARLKREGRDERGVVLVLVAIMMTVFLGMAALAIDVGYFYQQQRQAQSAADAAALAGAQDLPGSATNATSEAKTYVASNMPGVPQVYTCTTPATPGVCITTPYSSNSKQIQVTVTQNVPTLFGQIFGINSTNVSATAVAANTQSTLCAAPGNSCYAIFANDSTCTSGHYSLQFTGAGIAINGGILSNGSVTATGAGMSFGPSTYGPGTCKWTTTGAGNNFSSGPKQATGTTPPWPIDYRSDFLPCTGSGCTGACAVTTTPCPTADKTPSFCTMATTVTPTSLIPTSGNIYCAIGSGKANDPTSWTGVLSISGAGINAKATYVAASVSISGAGNTLTACGYGSSGYTASTCNATAPKPPTGNYPLIYATRAAIDDVGAGNILTGDLFAPLGTINFTGAGGSVGFLEGNDVNYTGAGLTGDGPSDSGGSPAPGLASLVQ
jgi:Flp pilus assembly protein TadG